ncbi:hypothetical protein GCM10007094_41750 [Pseudovibrio japonicus]|uniref:Uncharacterized protein n=1 Tax=Pseudovibrio japonicus TaxID=366534 RepID=A0ABQ3EUW4_9HYPH|nr:hypothetical protein [Pseudovibrio japonicus]GHB48183.1 hypothetical protein GCM10007094_41750 [Pseudovibrio japonicus]
MKPMKSDVSSTNDELSSGPVAPLAMPVQDLSADDESWFALAWRRVWFGRGASARPAKRARLQKAISIFSGR